MSLDDELRKLAQEKQNKVLAKKNEEKALRLEEESKKRIKLEYEKMAVPVAKSIVIPLLEKVNRDGKLNGRIEINGRKQESLLGKISNVIFASTNDILDWVNHTYPNSTIECALIWGESNYGWHEICITLRDGKFDDVPLTDPSIKEVIEQYIIKHLNGTLDTSHDIDHPSP